jgi:hypothetical protein
MALSSLNNTNWYTSLTSKRGLVGGVLELRMWEQIYPSSDVTADNSLALGSAIDGTHDIVIASGDYPDSAEIGTYRFAPEQSTFTVSTSQENGLALHTCSIEGFIPNLTSTELGALQELVGKGVMGVVKLNAGGSGTQTELLLGWDNVLGDTTDVSGTDHLTSKFALFLESIEASSGSAMADEVGATVKLTAVQGELPRQISAT